jgi:hypothetical protein
VDIKENNNALSTTGPWAAFSRQLGVHAAGGFPDGSSALFDIITGSVQVLLMQLTFILLKNNNKTFAKYTKRDTHNDAHFIILSISALYTNKKKTKT